MNQKRLQRHQLVQRRCEIIAAGYRFGETQHRITLTIGIAKHAQQLLLNVMQTRAVGAEAKKRLDQHGGFIRQVLDKE
jgi:N-acetylmuramic acid 6-phosphate (MurNAc-6-P) etherase